jgi:hypothetical protein
MPPYEEGTDAGLSKRSIRQNYASFLRPATRRGRSTSDKISVVSSRLVNSRFRSFSHPRRNGNLAGAYQDAGRLDEAILHYQRTLAGMQQTLGDKADPAARERFLQALAKYKDKKPMRQETPLVTTSKPQNEPPTKSKEPAALPQEPAAEKAHPAATE